MKHRILYSFLLFPLLFGLSLTSTAQNSDQTIVDPLTLSGTVGTQIVSTWNSEGRNYSAPFAATAYADMTFNIYGVSVPMSVNLINVDSRQFSFSKPVFTFNFRPTWRRFTLFLGTASMNFSNYTYNGISFNGVGLQYNGKYVRVGGFYGNFNRATTLRTELDERSAIQYLADSLLGMNNVAYTSLPQFKRKAYAAHIAFGSMRNYVDLSLLHAADDINSLPEQWYMYNVYSDNFVDTTLMVRDSTLKGMENLALGLKGHFTFGKWVMVEGNLGASLITPDVTRDEMQLDGSGTVIDLANSAIRGLRKIHLFNTRYGSELRFAGDALVRLNISPVTATFTYRFVQPDYITLGANGFNQNSRTFGFNMSSSLFNGKAFLGLNGYLQRDNLDKKQLYTNQVGSYAINWSNYFGDDITLAVRYNGVSQKQYDGTMIVPEDSRINRINHSIDVTPSYNLSLDNEHTFELNFNYLQNKNLNELMESTYFDASTLSFGLGYDLYLRGPRLSVSANYGYEVSHFYGDVYHSHNLSANANYNFIKKENLTFSGNARLIMVFNFEQTEADKMSESDKKMLEYLAKRVGREGAKSTPNDLSIATRLGATLNYKDQHRASCYLSVSNYSDNIVIGQHVGVSTDLRFTLEYSYSFASRLIKSKKR